MKKTLAREIQNEVSINRCLRKENQAWECAAAARQDRDTKDEARWTEEAQAWGKRAYALEKSSDCYDKNYRKAFK